MTPFRLLGWLTAAAMVALATLGPAAGTSLAAKPDVPGQNGNGQGNGQNGAGSDQGNSGNAGQSDNGGQNGNGGDAGDNACNNVLNGALSPDFVWVTADAGGVTVWWSQAADRFGTTGDMVVRACVIVDGAELGAIAQNTANDGSEAFGWSAFELDSDPCVASEVQVAGSVDGGSNDTETKKSAVITCSHRADEEQPPADEEQPPADEEQPPADEQNPPADEEQPPADDETTPPANDEQPPADDETTPPANDEQPGQPITDVQPSTEAAGPPAEQPVAQPVVESSVAPTESPTGAVLGAVGAPSITPPPTDTLGTVPATSSDGWRFILLGLAALLAALLLAMPDDRTNPRRRS